MKPLTWFLLGFTLILVAGVASAGYSFGDGQCYETRAQAMQAAYRTFPRLVGPANVETNLINLPDPCVEGAGFFLCSFQDGLGQSIGSYRLYPASCDAGIQDISFNSYWIAPAVVGFFALGWKLGMAR